MLGNLIGPEIKELIEERNFAALREAFSDWAPADIGECLTEIPEDEQAIVFRLLPHAMATEVFEYLDTEAQEKILKAMGHIEAARILNDMSPDDRTALLEELPGAAVAQMLQLLSPEEKAVAQSLLNYPDGTVGRLMTPEFVTVRESWTIAQVLDHVREFGRDSETLNVIYVTDDHGRLIDDVRIREFLIRPTTTLVSEFRDHQFVALRATDQASAAYDLFKKYDRAILPVIDSEEKLLGMVTVDDILDIQEEVTTEEMQKMGGMEALDEPYTTIALPRMIKKRATWLIILFLSEMLTATAMQNYNEEIAKATVLAMFLPLIMSSGGNSGSQATTLIIRAMGVGEVRLRDWFRIMRKELLAGLSLGVILGLIGFFRISLWQFLHIFDYGQYHWVIALTVGVSLIGVVMWGSVTGAMLPFVLRRFGLDPAVSSAPFVATLVDVTGLLIYFNVARVILHGTLL
ncbi:MAG: magnesium transporter [Chthoniobacter sp.]|uniref:magnesium transporter n=1 Tax=Chthoniobacter sp. TaxID=2510640 RepID=UPI0032ACEBFE